MRMICIEPNVTLPGNWRHRMTLQDLLLEFKHAREIPRDDVKRISAEIVKRLGTLAKRGGPGYSVKDVTRMLDAGDQEHFNRELLKLYGWCDENRVFVGEGA